MGVSRENPPKMFEVGEGGRRRFKLNDGSGYDYEWIFGSLGQLPQFCTKPPRPVNQSRSKWVRRRRTQLAQGRASSSLIFILRLQGK